MSNNERYVASSDRIGFRITELDEIPFILQMERDEANAPFIASWQEDVHSGAIESEGTAHWIIEKLPEQTPIGYLILPDCQNPNRSVELKRIVIGEKGAGFGRDAIRLLKRVIFEDWGKHRLWLDVMEHNGRARNLYRSEGFVEEGVWRDAFYRDGEYVSLIFMSILENEYSTMSLDAGVNNK